MLLQVDRAAFNEKEKILPLQNQAGEPCSFSPLLTLVIFLSFFPSPSLFLKWLFLYCRQEMVKIRGKIEGFREDVRSFRAEFLERCPFGSPSA